MADPGYFFITSYGRTSTTWLATAINLHPDMLCSHGPAMEPVIHRAGQELAGETKKESVNRAQNTTAAFNALSLGEILARLGKGSGKAFVGNVHAFTASNLSIKAAAEPGRPPFRAINLLRHPVNRAHSFWRRMEYERAIDTPAARWIADEAMQQPNYRDTLTLLRSRYDVPLDQYGDRAFFHAVMVLGTDAGDLPVKVQHVPSERLVSDIDYFAYVLTVLTGAGSIVRSSHLREVQQLGKLNASEGGKDVSAMEVFESWLPWQRALFQTVIGSSPLLKAAYPMLGYGVAEFGVA